MGDLQDIVVDPKIRESTENTKYATETSSPSIPKLHATYTSTLFVSPHLYPSFAFDAKRLF